MPDERLTNLAMISIESEIAETLDMTEHGRPQGGGKRAFAPPLEIGTQNQNFLENLSQKLNSD